MSDGAPGEGWWQASDGQWYPPDQHPDVQAGTTPPTAAMPPTSAMPPTAAMPPVAPPSPPMGPPPMGPPPMGAPTGPPPGAPTSSNAKWIVVGVLAVAVLAIGAFLLLGGDDKKKVVASSSSSSSSSSSKSSSSSSSRSSSSSSKSSSSAPTEADLQSLMLKASDISPTFKDTTFTPDTTTPTPCGQPNAAAQFPPVIDVGSTAQSSDGSLFFQEELTTYDDASTAQQAFQVGLQGFDCTQATANDSSAITISAPKDASATLGVPGAIELDIQGANFTEQVFAAVKDNAIVLFAFGGATNADTSGVPSPESLAKKGFQKLGA